MADRLTPRDDDPLVPEDDLDALEEELLADDDPEDLVVAESPPPPLGRSWAFDFAQQRFVRGGSKGPLETHDDATLRTWIEKCLRTERASSPVHPQGYGLERAYDGFGEPHGSEELADLEERVRDALTFHPRITGLRRFSTEYDPDDDYVAVRFEVVRDDETVLPIQTSLG